MEKSVRKGLYSMQQKHYVTGLTPLRLQQLCQPEQLERTMHLLFSLNHWAKARDRLFYVDRQGLYAVKGAILRQAYAAGAIEAKAYIDGIEGFGAELAFDIAAEITAESVLWRLEEIADLTDPEKYDESDRAVVQFYTTMTGKSSFTEKDLAALEISQVQEYVIARLREIEQQARIVRQPISRKKLTELCIAPCDLLCIRDQRYYKLGDWTSWEQLDEGDLHKLDPEGLSLIAFRYTSPIAHYVFHVPFRLTEVFLPKDCLSHLKSRPTVSREHGEYYGRAITEAESLQYPIADILRELGVDILSVCPRLLSDKQEYVLAQAMRYASWASNIEDDDDEDLDEVFWQDVAAMEQKQISQPLKGGEEVEACPLCNQAVSTTSDLARLEHWQREHPGQDLTFSQVSWVLKREISKEQFCQAHPPDYRSPHEKGFGTRFWRVETLTGLWQVKATSESQV